MLSKISRKLRRTTWVSLLILSGLFRLTISACAQTPLTTLSVEQIRAQLPQIQVYLHSSEETVVPHAYLDGNELSYIETLSAGDTPTSYFIMLDISGSIPSSYFNAAKSQIVQLAERMAPNDRLTLITFGDTVEIRLDSARDAASVAAILEPMQAQDSNTCLYEAIYTVADRVKASSDGERQLVLIVSDGLQDTGSVGITRQELQEHLEQISVPIYSFCIDRASQTSQEELGRFARATGGCSFVFSPESAGPVWSDWNAYQKDHRILCYQAATNHADGALHTLLLKFTRGEHSESISQQICLTDWIPDKLPPHLADSLYQETEHMITLRFSEPVLHADESGSYLIRKKSESWAVTAVAVQPDGSYQLSIPNDLAPGDYQLLFFGITDDSMEENTLIDTGSTFQIPLRAKDVLPYALLTVLGLIILMLALVLHRRRSAARQTQSVEYSVHHIPAAETPSVCSASEEPDTALLEFLCLEGIQTGMRLELQIRKSSIWGRSASMCDVCFDDPRISKQHCALEVHDHTLTLRDLGSQNGTYLNNIRVTGIRHLQNGDQLRLGDTTLRIEHIHIHR